MPRSPKVTTGQDKPSLDQVQAAIFVLGQVEVRTRAERHMRAHATAVVTAHLSGFLPGSEPDRPPFGFAAATQ